MKKSGLSWGEASGKGGDVAVFSVHTLGFTEVKQLPGREILKSVQDGHKSGRSVIKVRNTFLSYLCCRKE